METPQAQSGRLLSTPLRFFFQELDFLLQLQEEKIRAIQEKLELAEQKLAQYAKLPDMEEELKLRMEALSQVRAQVRYKPLLCRSAPLGPLDRLSLDRLSLVRSLACARAPLLC